MSGKAPTCPAQFIAALIAIFAATPAVAQTFDVKQLDIQKGALELGLDNTVQGRLPPDANLNRSAHDQSLDYGVSDRWRLSGVFKLENPDADHLRFAKAAVENIFVLKPIPKQHGIGLGWFTSLEASVDHATTNSLIFGPIVTLKDDRLSFTANPFFEKTFGRNNIEGIALNYAWHVKYEVRTGLAVGIEGFGVVENLGNSPALRDQEHRVGPAIFTEIALTKDLKITPDIGLLFGLTRATPDVALKFNVGVPLSRP